jgi:hypothetical protein
MLCPGNVAGVVTDFPQSLVLIAYTAEIAKIFVDVWRGEGHKYG